MSQIIFATNNLHKLSEIRQHIGERYEILSLKDIGFNEDIPEPYETLEENALEKARVIHEKFGMDCFAEDTGLEVYALDMEPGVYSARYAGDERAADANMRKVLEKLKNKTDRRARFRTVIALIIDNKKQLFEGIAEGKITMEPSGAEGFGYDPIFMPDGYNTTFAQMTSHQKNTISHRGKATDKFIGFLSTTK